MQTFTRRLHDNQFIRYLLVGGFNTAFGYGLFSLAFYLLHPHLPNAHLAAAVVSNILAIAVAFLGYKFIVFRTKGNYLAEFFRCYVVYGAAFLLSIALLAVFVNACHMNVYLAQALVVGITMVVSFVSHQRFSFRVAPSADRGASTGSLPGA